MFPFRAQVLACRLFFIAFRLNGSNESTCNHDANSYIAGLIALQKAVSKIAGVAGVNRRTDRGKYRCGHND